MSEYTKNQGYEIGWDDEIKNESTFSILPAGEYTFKVTKFERARHEGSAKLPACNKAIISMELTNVDGTRGFLQHNLFLHSSTEGMMCAFFTGIGQRKHGEALRPRWNEVVGSTGTCTVGIRKYTNNKGEERETNEIKKFHEKQAPAVPSFGGGSF